MIGLHHQSIRSTIRTITLLAAITALLLTMVAPFVGTAVAADNPYNAADGILDAAAGTPINDVCADANDTHPIGGAVKVDTIHAAPAPVIKLEQSGPGKSDFCTVWFESTVDSHGDVWLYFAFQLDAESGSQTLYLELLQQAADCDVFDYATCNPFENRDAGSQILGFDYNGNNTVIDVQLRDWNVGAQAFDPFQPVGTNADGAAGPEGSGFGEIAVNLSQPPANPIVPNVNVDAPCQIVAAGLPYTITGNSDPSGGGGGGNTDSASMIDIVIGSAEPITNCGSLTVTKQVVGDDDFGQSFPVTLADGADLDRTENLGDGDSFTEADLYAGSNFTVSESVPAGWTIESIACSDGSSSGQGVTSLSGIAVAAGETTSCTVTNAPILPTITLEKTVVNDDGGSLAQGDFPSFLDGDALAWDTTVATTPGQHTASETSQPGYTAGDWGGDCAADGTFTAALGGDYTCTITNDDIAPTVVLRKTVVNDDGGTLAQDDFPSFLDGDALAWDDTVEILAGNHTASETQQDGYTSLGWAGDCAADGTFTAAVGGTYECTITNDDVAVGLTVVKEVQNNWGGTLVPADFPLSVNGDVVASGAFANYPAGDYTIAELQQDGYELVGSSCTRDNDPVAGISGESFDISVANGETVVCTFVNRDLPASLTVLKDVVNDDGGTATEDDFTPVVNDGETFWGSQDTTIGDQSGVAAGSYTIGELLADGYELTDISCTDETTLADGDSTVTVALGLGDSVTCTVTNDDIAPTVVLTKVVVNDDGGTLTADDFPATLDGADVAWGETVTTTAGDHVAAEESQGGYVAGDWGGDCAADGSLTAELGGTYECTITNDDVPAGLTVVKQVVNDDGASATVADFPLTVTPEGGTAVTVTSGVETIVAAGTYTITEEQQPGYTLDSMSCDNGTATTEDELTVTVGLDEAVICTIVNDDLPISIQVIKVPDVEEVDFLPGGQDEVITYTYTVTNTGALPLTDLSLVDDILGGIELPVAELVPGQTVLATATHVVTAEDATAGEVVNVVVVTGTSPDGRTTDDDDVAEVIVNPAPVLPDVAPAPAPLPATGVDTDLLALWAALIAALGVMLLLGLEQFAPADGRRRD